MVKFDLLDETAATSSTLTKKAATRYRGIHTAIENIVSTAKSVIADLEGSFYVNYQPKENLPFCYTDKKLAPSEIEFYQNCCTPKGVLDLHHQCISEVIQAFGIYKLFPTHTFSEQQLKGNHSII